MAPRVNLQHQFILISNIEKEPVLLTKNFEKISKEQYKRKWRELAEKLNDVGKVKKTAAQWRNYLMSWKRRAEKKDDEDVEEKRLNGFEKRLLGIVLLEKVRIWKAKHCVAGKSKNLEG
ncbi:uncharacterized protein LOC122502762 isoform X1 [Leptopilina heterotoma]|uniref:uncharacterized protein LOC122502762 isoform X1 n=1 Tax=Leptopilina heterotoma TaxID=63436 RepID=UPI001CAA2A5B|nr:uncharacterized protein LOC122502762 isoform X1 [Leptopilina heterotoma]XP_043468896.1 uncharacterized protein LOC122502762 isoform X1 [Leptopilina heterotoma]